MQRQRAQHQQAAQHQFPHGGEGLAPARCAAFRRAHEGQSVPDHAVRHRAAHGELQGHGRNRRAERGEDRRPHPRAVEHHEMQQHHREGREHRQSQYRLRHGNAQERDKRHPDQVENGDQHAQRLGAEPGEPAEQIVAALLRREPAAARQESAPVLLDQLDAAIGPAMALPLIGGEVARQQAPAIARLRVMRAPAALEQREPEIGILDDGVARPAPGGDQRLAPDQAHRAMHDDGVGLVPLHHADIEEAGIFAVHRHLHEAARGVAVVLRRLHQADGRIGEGRHEILQPVGTDHIVGVEHADDLGLRRGVLEREPERSSLESLEPIGAHEFEARPKQPAVILDRLPKGGVGRVVDDHHAFEIRPIELRHAVERLPQHLRRLAIGRNVNRDQRQLLRQRSSRRQQAPGLRPEQNGGEFLDAPLHDHDERHEQAGTGEQRDLRAEHEIMRDPIIDDIGRPGADGVRGERQHAGLGKGHARDGEDRNRQQDADGKRGDHLEEKVRLLDRCRPRRTSDGGRH